MSVEERALPLQRFLHWVYETPDAPFLVQPTVAGDIKVISWRDAHHQVVRIAQWLQRFPKGSRVAIYSLNCAHWILADLAIWYAGHVSVPIYPTAGADTIEGLLIHSECAALFAGKLTDFEQKRSAVPSSVAMVSMHQKHENLVDWDEIVLREQPMIAPAACEPESLATIIYTSGTTGQPKGVMQTFAAAAFVSERMAEVTVRLGLKEGVFFSYLPMAHVAERCAIELACLVLGGTIHFVASIDTFARDLARTRPTVFFGVPRIWLKMQQGISSKISEDRLQRILRLPLFGRLFSKMLRKKLGLDRAKVILSGGASIEVGLLQWWDGVGIEILEVYGMTETFAYSHLNLPGNRGVGTVGECMAQSECNIADDGEVLIRHQGIMSGFYKDPVMTNEVLQDGWIHTGDLGRFDENNRLVIVGRKKDIFKTEKGKYVSPVPIETQLELAAGFEQVCVVGSGLAQPVAIAVLQNVATELKEDWINQLHQILDDLNSRLDPHERLQGVILVTERWSTDNGLLTPTLKIRRSEIEKNYSTLIREYLKSEKRVFVEVA